VETTTTSGPLSIDVGAPGGIKKAIPVLTSGFLPGDSLSRALNLENSGNVALSSVNLANSASPSGPLVTDQVNGLQLTLERCSRAWTAGGTEQLPTHTCGGTRTVLYTGPAITTAPLSAPDSLTPGREDNLVFTLSLPSTAGNDMQALSATVNLAFTAVQAPGTARYLRPSLCPEVAGRGSGRWRCVPATGPMSGVMWPVEQPAPGAPARGYRSSMRLARVCPGRSSGAARRRPCPPNPTG
jgi:hypothetical protein